MQRRTSALALIAAIGLVLSISVGAVSARSSQASMRAGLFHITLTGAQEASPTCAPPTVCGDPDAVAQAFLIVLPGADKVCFFARWRGIDGTVTAAHIHLAPPGVPGPVVVPLFSGTFAGSDRTWGCVSGMGAAAAIVADPGAYYVNIHSTVYPAGAVRAQL